MVKTLYERTDNKGKAGGYPPLDGDRKIPIEYIPDVTTNSVRCSASFGTTVSPNASTKLIASTPSYDPLNMVDTTNSEIVMPQDGWYLICVTFGFGGLGNADACEGRIFNNGGQVMHVSTRGFDSFGSNVRSCLSHVFRLVEGDRIDFRVIHDHGGPRSCSATVSVDKIG